MSWLKLDDQLPDHPKVAGLTDGAFRLHLTALCYCSRHLTDGLVPEPMIHRWGVRHADRAAHELASARLWRPVEGGWLIHDYLEHQRSRADVEGLSEKRAAAGRKGGKAKAAAKQLASGVPGKREAETETEPDTDLVTGPRDPDDDRAVRPLSSSSDPHPHWQLITEAAQVAARLRVPAPKNPDGYATQVAANILREQGWLIDDLIAARPDLDQAGLAHVLATDGASKAIQTAEDWAAPIPTDDPAWIPAEDLT